MGGLPRKQPTIRGRLVFEDGEPVTGFDVVVLGRKHDFTSAFSRTSISSDDGSFRIQVPRGANLRVVFENTDVPRFLASQKNVRDLRVKQHAHDFGSIVVGRLRYATLRGLVSVPDEVNVDTIFLQPTRYRARLSVAPNQSFEFRVPIDCTQIDVFAPGLPRHLWKHSQLRFGENEEVEIPPIHLAATREVRGSVRLADGSPCPRVEVNLGSSFSAGFDSNRTIWDADVAIGVSRGQLSGARHADRTLTDEFGKFVFRGVPPESFSVLASDGASVGLAPVAGDQDNCLITLEPAGSVSGRLESRRKGWLVSLNSQLEGGGCSLLRCNGAPCDSWGNFKLPLMPPGRYRISAFVVESRECSVGVRQVEIQPGEDLQVCLRELVRKE